MATVTREQEAPHQGHELRRHVGVIGLLFASVGSIIGSGWLFGALNASVEAGPAAIISWPAQGTSAGWAQTAAARTVMTSGRLATTCRQVSPESTEVHTAPLRAPT